jgi:hypothetical protein
MIWNAQTFGVPTSSISWSRVDSLLISGLHRDGFVHPLVWAFPVYNHGVDRTASVEVVAYGVVSTGTDDLTISGRRRCVSRRSVVGRLRSGCSHQTVTVPSTS